MRAGLSLGWPPSEVWAATLHELEDAVALRMETIEAQSRTAVAMDEGEMRQFYDKLAAADA
jgi:hypothetical protein